VSMHLFFCVDDTKPIQRLWRQEIPGPTRWLVAKRRAACYCQASATTLKVCSSTLLVTSLNEITQVC
jgi:hypothetical protein